MLSLSRSLGPLGLSVVPAPRVQGYPLLGTRVCELLRLVPYSSNSETKNGIAFGLSAGARSRGHPLNSAPLPIAAPFEGALRPKYSPPGRLPYTPGVCLSIPPLILVARDQSWQVHVGLSFGRLPCTPSDIVRRGVFLVLPAVPLRGQRASVAPSCFRGHPGSRELAPFSN